MYKNQNIKFSVMMNCFNGEKYLEEAIVNQTSKLGANFLGQSIIW